MRSRVPWRPPSGELLPVLEREPGRIRIAVDEVEAVTSPLPKLKGHALIARRLEREVEACYGYSDELVDESRSHGLFEAVHLAFSDHRPLILSPDAIWLTLVQGFAHHIALDPERHRAQLVPHEGRARLAILREDFVEGSPENPWAEVFSAFEAELRERIGDELADWLTSPFSTTGPVERAAFSIALMDALTSYYDFAFKYVCGIPWIELTGSEADWADLQQRARRFRGFDLGGWCDALDPVLVEFTEAAAGRADSHHWRDIYKLRRAYGEDTINGWLLSLCPYILDPITRRATVPNPVLTGESEDLAHSQLPRGMCEVPVRVESRRGSRLASFCAGLVGARQDPESGALSPVVGWAVTRGNRLQQLLEAMTRGASHRVSPPSREAFAEAVSALSGIGLPAELIALLEACDGATLHAPSAAPIRLRGGAAIELLSFSGDPRVIDAAAPALRVERRGWTGRRAPERLIFPKWLIFADHADGSRLALEARCKLVVQLPRERPAPGELVPIIAEGFEDALELLLARPGTFEDQPVGWAAFTTER